MRLWHYALIPYLPNKQLVAQWRELNSIFKKRDKHILINFIYEYADSELFLYTCEVIIEMLRRGIHFRYSDNYNNFAEDFKGSTFYWIFHEAPYFTKHMDDDYLKICCWNLYEKYIRGQEGFTEEALKFIEGVIKKGKK